jgi:hypothetical protein
MIDKQHGEYSLICNICDETGEIFSSFEDAVDYKKECGWKSKKQGDEWIDICPDCNRR